MASRALGNVCLGDLVRAWRILRPRTSEERRAIAEVLGFDYTPPAPKTVGRDSAPEQPVMTGTAEQPASESSDAVSESPSRAEAEARARSRLTVPVTVLESHPAPTGRSTPVWLRVDEPLAPERAEHLSARPAYDPLFWVAWTPAILSAACATTTDDGPIDIEQLVERVAMCRPVTIVPRQQLASLRRGVELLVDRGENMVLFARDARDLVRRLREVVGRVRTSVSYFADCPMLGAGSGGRSSWRTYEPPAPGIPVALLTDFGIARGSAGRSAATETLWRAFIERTRAAGCPVIAFVPYPLHRWPPRLMKLVRAVPWDRTTSVALVRHAAQAEQWP